MFNLYQVIYTNNSSNSLIQNPQIQTQPLVYPFILPGHNQGFKLLLMVTSNGQRRASCQWTLLRMRDAEVEVIVLEPKLL